MSQISKPETTKTKLQKYGLLVGYSMLGMIGLGLFTFKLIMMRQQNMEKIRQKSRVPIMHKNMKTLAIGGLLGIAAYTYGLYQIMRRVPESQTNLQMADYSQLTDINKKNAEMQDHYILKTMRLFGVSENLIDKTKKQFAQMSQTNTITSEEKDKSLNSELFWALIQRKKIEKKYDAQNGQKN